MPNLVQGCRAYAGRKETAAAVDAGGGENEPLVLRDVFANYWITISSRESRSKLGTCLSTYWFLRVNLKMPDRDYWSRSK
jgi:hypothetical protein